MKSILFKTLLLALCVFTAAPQVQAQDEVKNLSVPELFRLTRENHPNLKVSRADIAVARQGVAVARTALLPAVTVGIQASYLGDATIFSSNFSDAVKRDMPHFGNSFAVQATELIWKGNTLQNNIRVQSLKEDIASLSYESNEQNIKLMVLGYYLDLYKMWNQEGVYQKNIALANDQLRNINRLYKEGMVTRNDVIRGELQLSRLGLALNTVQHNRQILNKQLTIVLGLPEATTILPDSSLQNPTFSAGPLAQYKAAANSHPSLLITQKAAETYEVAGKIINATRLPYLSGFAGNQLQRPITTTVPALDMYANGWSAGLALGFDLDALYKTPQKLAQNRYEQTRARAQSEETRKYLEVAINAAYIKYNEAVTQQSTYVLNKDLAVENYRIMESKYNNQLAILLDLLDASNAKLQSELEFTNAEANIVYTYYKLRKESGQL